mgnify:FL=1
MFMWWWIKVVEVTIPELEQMRRAHYITLGTEINASLGDDYMKWYDHKACQRVL